MELRLTIRKSSDIGPGAGRLLAQALSEQFILPECQFHHPTSLSDQRNQPAQAHCCWVIHTTRHLYTDTV